MDLKICDMCGGEITEKNKTNLKVVGEDKNTNLEDVCYSCACAIARAIKDVKEAPKAGCPECGGAH
jgi:hypothetical protein